MAPPYMPGSWVCRSNSRARCQSKTACFLGIGVNWTGFAVLSDQTGKAAYVCSDIAGRPGRIYWENVGMGVRPRLSRGAHEGNDRSQFPASKWGLLFCRRYPRLGLPAPIFEYLRLGVPAAPLIGRRWHVYGSGSAVAPWQLPHFLRQLASLSHFRPSGRDRLSDWALRHPTGTILLKRCARLPCPEFRPYRLLASPARKGV